LPVAVPTEAGQLINKEFVALLQHDSIAYPLPGTNRSGAIRSSYEVPDDGDMDLAKVLIRDELASTLGMKYYDEAEIRGQLQSPADLKISWAYVRENLAFDPRTAVWRDIDALPHDILLTGMASRLEHHRETMAREAEKAGKQEKKLSVQLGGYQARSKALSKRVADAFEGLQKAKFDLESFSRLHINEQAIGPRRIEALRDEVASLERRELLLQGNYRDLQADRDALLTKVSELEDRVMADAEALNEAALAQT